MMNQVGFAPLIGFRVKTAVRAPAALPRPGRRANVVMSFWDLQKAGDHEAFWAVLQGRPTSLATAHDEARHRNICRYYREADASIDDTSGAIVEADQPVPSAPSGVKSEADRRISCS